MSMFLGEHPDHRLSIRKDPGDYRNGESWCSCGWEFRGTYLDAETAAGRHFASTREKRFRVFAPTDLSGLQAGMPQGLSVGERAAYRKGWDRAALKYAKDNGLPAQFCGPGEDLGQVTAAYNLRREPIAHKAGMSALSTFRKNRGITAPKTRRTTVPSTCPACGHDLSKAVAA